MNQQRKRTERERSKKGQSPSTRRCTLEESGGSWIHRGVAGEAAAGEVAVAVGAGAVAGGDSAAQSEVVDDSHGKVDSGDLRYQGVLEVENGECETQFPPRLRFGLYRSSNYETGA